MAIGFFEKSQVLDSRGLSDVAGQLKKQVIGPLHTMCQNRPSESAQEALRVSTDLHDKLKDIALHATVEEKQADSRDTPIP